MNEQLQQLRSNSKTVLLLFVLICAGFAGNFFSPRLFIGFNYLFGSTAVLLVVYLYGTRWGVAAGLIASSCTFFQLGHPYAMIWLCGEPLFVGWLLSKGRTRNIILYDAVYWPCIGGPLLWIFFRHVMHVPLLDTVAALLMCWVSGITNALVASLLLTYFPRLATRGELKAAPPIPIQKLIFNLLMAVVLLPAMVIMVIHGKDAERRTLDSMYDGVEDSSRIALYEIRLKLQKQIAVLKELSSLAGKLDLAAQANLEQLQRAAELLYNSNADFHLIYVGNASGHSVAHAPAHDTQGRPVVSMDLSDREYYKIIRKNQTPVASDLLMTRGAVTAPGVALAVPFVSKGAFQGFAVASAKTSTMRDVLLAARVRPFYRMTIVDGANRVIASTGDLNTMDDYDSCKNGVAAKVTPGGVYSCVPNSASALPLWQQAQKSTYLLTVPVVNNTAWSIVTEAPFAPYQKLLLEEHIKALLVVLALNMFALLASLYASRRLTAPLRRLSLVTTDLPERLLREKITSWPVSMVAEIDQLSDNFMVMTTALGNKFQEITYAKETLEHRVEERTRELTKSNDELQNEINERKRTERQRDHLMDELVNQVRFLQLLIDAIPNPIFYKDANGLYQGCNKAFEESWGLTRQEIVGKSVHELYPAEMAEIFNKADQELFKARGVQVYEAQTQYKSDGLNHAVIFYKALYEDSAGNPAGLVGTVVDITARKKIETERDRLMAELKQKNKELEGIIYVASHDLRSPLVNVQGFSRKLAKNCAELDRMITGLEMDAAQRLELEPLLRESIPRSLVFITGSVEKMDSLLNGLLRLSRLGRAALCFDTLDMRAILEKIVTSMTYQIDSVDARVELGELAPCMSDAGQVTQVFSNLIDNAVKYRSPDRPLVINVFSEELENGIRYCVSDNGVGILCEHQDTIWEIFHRLNPDDTQGEGLGLTMAQRIIDRLGGSIWVESEPGSGSRFYVLLPKPAKMTNH